MAVDDFFKIVAGIATAGLGGIGVAWLNAKREARKTEARIAVRAQLREDRRAARHDREWERLYDAAVERLDRAEKVAAEAMVKCDGAETKLAQCEANSAVQENEIKHLREDLLGAFARIEKLEAQEEGTMRWIEYKRGGSDGGPVGTPD